jgi:hypothetical protein
LCWWTLAELGNTEEEFVPALSGRGLEDSAFFLRLFAVVRGR